MDQTLEVLVSHKYDSPISKEKTTCKWNMGGEQYYTFQKFCASKGWLFLAAAKEASMAQPVKCL